MREVTMAYPVPGDPAAVLIDRDGNIANVMVYGANPISRSPNLLCRSGFDVDMMSVPLEPEHGI